MLPRLRGPFFPGAEGVEFFLERSLSGEDEND